MKLEQVVFGTEVIGVLCLIECEGRLLFVRHAYGNRRLWQLPGGRLHPGESPWAAILRELMEELQVRPQNLRSLGKVELRQFRKVTRLHLFTGRLESPTVTCTDGEIAESHWFPRHHPPLGIGPGARTAVHRWRSGRYAEEYRATQI